MKFDGVDFWMGNHHTFELKGENFTSGELLGKITSEVRVGKTFDTKLVEIRSSTFSILVPNEPLNLIVRVYHNKAISYFIEMVVLLVDYNFDHHTGYITLSFRCLEIECND